MKIVFPFRLFCDNIGNTLYAHAYGIPLGNMRRLWLRLADRMDRGRDFTRHRVMMSVWRFKCPSSGKKKKKNSSARAIYPIRLNAAASRRRDFES